MLAGEVSGDFVSESGECDALSIFFENDIQEAPIMLSIYEFLQFYGWYQRNFGRPCLNLLQNQRVVYNDNEP